MRKSNSLHLCTPTIKKKTLPIFKPQPKLKRKKKQTINENILNQLPQGLGVVSLSNCGSNIPGYFNSILLSLLNCEGVINYFFNASYENHLNKASEGTEGNIGADFARLFEYYWLSNVQRIPTNYIYETVKRHCTQGIQKTNQIIKFLDWFLCSIRDDFNKLNSQQKPVFQYEKEESDQKLSLKYLSLIYKQDISFITPIFNIQFKETSRCLNCRQRAIRFPSSYYLDLPVPKYRENDLIILVIFQDWNKLPKKYYLNFEKNPTLHELTEKIKKKCNQTNMNFYFADIYHSRIYQEIKTDQDLNYIKITTNNIVAYEVKKTQKIKKSNTEIEEQIIIELKQEIGQLSKNVKLADDIMKKRKELIYQQQELNKINNNLISILEEENKCPQKVVNDYSKIQEMNNKRKTTNKIIKHLKKKIENDNQKITNYLQKLEGANIENKYIFCGNKYNLSSAVKILQKKIKKANIKISNISVYIQIINCEADQFRESFGAGISTTLLNIPLFIKFEIGSVSYKTIEKKIMKKINWFITKDKLNEIESLQKKNDLNKKKNDLLIKETNNVEKTIIIEKIISKNDPLTTIKYKKLLSNNHQYHFKKNNCFPLFQIIEMFNKTNTIKKIYQKKDQIYINEKTVLGLKWNPLLFLNKPPIITMNGVTKIERGDFLFEIAPIINLSNVNSKNKKLQLKENHFLKLECCLDRYFSPKNSSLNYYQHTKQFKCIHCHKHNQSKTFLEISHFPDTLIINLNRDNLKEDQRNCRPIKYPLELDLSKFYMKKKNNNDCTNKGNRDRNRDGIGKNNDKYQNTNLYYLSCVYLFSDVDNLNYKILIRNLSNGIWHKFKNQKICQIGLQEVLNNPFANILFYQKKLINRKNVLPDYCDIPIMEKIENLQRVRFEKRFKNTIKKLNTIMKKIDKSTNGKTKKGRVKKRGSGFQIQIQIQQLNQPSSRKKSSKKK
ncbi:ubiquitin carboxyl-terminal hydrolase [Anaeramoeba flamelloides]|uniref:Ubiquitin carboxyl-terminal hydrolase n=1 Tax=Anaeramoeba flamelloides TaxID=1746091 RepID=A0ABQ8YFI2_9EUKA|nr:ubiquitin carboxyl-terminal hydrolase [Anaeramoeba flamelloides]